MNYLYRESITYWHWSLPVIFQDFFRKLTKPLCSFLKEVHCVRKSESERIEFLMVMNKNSQGKSLLRAYDLQSMTMKTFHLGACPCSGCWLLSTIGGEEAEGQEGYLSQTRVC